MRGSLEAAILDVLWSADRGLRCQEVLDRFNRTRDEPLAYTTVMTVLKRLTDKGAATRQKSGRGYTYRATCADHAGLDVRLVLSRHGETAVARFVDQISAEPRLQEHLFACLRELETERRGA